MARAFKTDAPLFHANYAEILFELARELGADKRLLLQGTGIAEPVLRNPNAMLSFDQFIGLVRNALRLTGQPGLGLIYGHHLTFTSHGALAQAAVSGDTLQQAIELLIKYYRIRFSQIDLRFFIEGDRAVIQLNDLMDMGDLMPFLVESLFVTLMDVNGLLFGNKLTRDGGCRFAYPRPSWAEHYRTVFYDGAQFDVGVNQLHFDAALLSLPMALASPVTRRQAEVQCEAALRKLQQNDTLLNKVTRLLENAETELPNMEAIATALHMTARTLRRQLDAFGVRFQDLQGEIQRRRAKRLLETTSLTVDEVAHRLGYNDPSNFGRAFRKWTGMSPSDWRRQRHQVTND